MTSLTYLAMSPSRSFQASMICLSVFQRGSGYSQLLSGPESLGVSPLASSLSSFSAPNPKSGVSSMSSSPASIPTSDDAFGDGSSLSILSRLPGVEVSTRFKRQSLLDFDPRFWGRNNIRGVFAWPIPRLVARDDVRGNCVTHCLDSFWMHWHVCHSLPRCFRQA